MEKRKKKRGITFIEVVISLAVFGAILVPVSNMVLTTVVINKESQDKQQGTLIVQKALEKVKLEDYPTKDKIIEFLTSDLNMESYDESTKKGYIYYAKDGQAADAADYAFKVEVEVNDTTSYSSSNISEGITNGLEVSGIDTIKCYKDGSSSSEYDVSSPVTIILKSSNSGGYIYAVKVDSTIVQGSESNIISEADISNYLDYTINIDNNISSDNSLIVNVENSTEKNLNLYINKSSSVDAQYTINNKYGRVKQFLNSTPQANYENIKNSVKLSMRIYESKGKELADIEGIKNLSE